MQFRISHEVLLEVVVETASQQEAKAIDSDIAL